ncbi:membrane protein [Kurthia sp. 3B1D]|uniref:Membrane protein n=1 Tax=Candidatus Kurthia intestinigallinarum TaxID=1562256 RepID=A0A433RV18_9BACL|nr:DMT family transporter [Kurthia sp. 3B1D]RUS57124.1 membrane protein [Kurthia sp. 3B1D]
MSHTRANLLLISIAIAWGSSYIFMKVGLESLNTSSIIVWRFALAFIVMAALFYKKIIRVTKQTLVASAILALPLYGVFVFLLNGMQSTTVSTASFLTSTTVVFVPLLHALITKHIPSRKTMMSLAVVVAGLALLTIGDDFGLSYGAILCLLCAICNALYLVWTNHYAKKVQPLQLGIFQLGFTALYGCVGFAVEAPMMPATMNEWMAILGMALLCSAYGYVLQPVAQRYTSAEEAGFIFSLEPVFAVIFAFMIFGEVMTGVAVAGAVLILSGVLIANYVPKTNVFMKKEHL